MRRLSLPARLSSGVVCAITLCTVLPSIASAQTNSFTTGTAFIAPFLTSAGTTGSLMNGMQVHWTFADGAVPLADYIRFQELHTRHHGAQMARR